MDLSIYTWSELQSMEKELNLTEDEKQIFFMLARHRSRIEMADKTKLSIRSVDRRINSIKKKIKRI